MPVSSEVEAKWSNVIGPTRSLDNILVSRRRPRIHYVIHVGNQEKQVDIPLKQLVYRDLGNQHVACLAELICQAQESKEEQQKSHFLCKFIIIRILS